MQHPESQSHPLYSPHPPPAMDDDQNLPKNKSSSGNLRHWRPLDIYTRAQRLGQSMEGFEYEAKKSDLVRKAIRDYELTKAREICVLSKVE